MRTSNITCRICFGVAKYLKPNGWAAAGLELFHNLRGVDSGERPVPTSKVAHSDYHVMVPELSCQIQIHRPSLLFEKTSDGTRYPLIYYMNNPTGRAALFWVNYAARSGNFLTTFRDVLSVPSSGVKIPWLLLILDLWIWDRYVVPKRR